MTLNDIINEQGRVKVSDLHGNHIADFYRVTQLLVSTVAIGSKYFVHYRNEMYNMRENFVLQKLE